MAQYQYQLARVILLMSLMKSSKVKSEYSTQIRGRNFYGNVQIDGNLLNLDLTQFMKGGFYTLELIQLNLQKEFKRFLVFKNISDLFQELIENENMEISDQNTLIIPIDVTYKGRKFDLKIQLPLLQKKFDNDGQKMQNLFETIEKINQQKIKMQEYFPQLINFKGDKSNQKYNTYQVSQNGKTIKKLGPDQWTCFNHFLPLKKKGIFYFKAKIIKTNVNRYFFFGLCTKQVQSKMHTDLYMSPFFMGFLLHNGNIYGNNKNTAVASGYTIVEGQSIITVEIDMNKKLISWLHNVAKLFTTEIPKELVNLSIYPIVALHQNGDSLEFLDQ